MKAKDNIEEIILKRLKHLNESEPLEGHFERFQSKLYLQHKTKRITFNIVLKVAAAVVFILLATNQAFIYLSPNQQGSLLTVFHKNEATLSSVSSEYEEVEFYYTNAINVELNQWNTLNNEGFISAEEQKMMDDELGEFENRYKTLQADLAANPKDERVVNAILEYYQSKLNVINIIVNKLEEVKNKNNNHETSI